MAVDMGLWCCICLGVVELTGGYGVSAKGGDGDWAVIKGEGTVDFSEEEGWKVKKQVYILINQSIKPLRVFLKLLFFKIFFI